MISSAEQLRNHVIILRLMLEQLNGLECAECAPGSPEEELRDWLIDSLTATLEGAPK